MTIGELVEQLSGFDPSTLVCIDTLWRPGLYPAADAVSPYVAEMGDVTYRTVVLRASDWP